MPTESKSTVLISYAISSYHCPRHFPAKPRRPGQSPAMCAARAEFLVPAATVQLINPQTGERKETWTDEEGILPSPEFRLAIIV